MSILKLFVIFLTIGIISAVAYLVNQQHPIFPSALANFSPQVSTVMVSAKNTIEQTISSIKENQLKPLGDVWDRSGIIKEDTSAQKPIHQKAFEFGRYEYCKQVIRDFEAEKAKK